MSIFYCAFHQRMEDEDFVGYELLGDAEFCTEGAEEFLKDLPEINETEEEVEK